MAHTFANLLAHVIFSTKDREPLIASDLKPDLLAYMGGIVRELQGKLRQQIPCLTTFTCSCGCRPACPSPRRCAS